MPVVMVKGAADAVPILIARIRAAKEPITGCNVEVFMDYPFAFRRWPRLLRCARRSIGPAKPLAMGCYAQEGNHRRQVHARMFEILPSPDHPVWPFRARWRQGYSPYAVFWFASADHCSTGSHGLARSPLIELWDDRSGDSDIAMNV